MEIIWDFGLSIIHALQSLGWLAWPMQAITQLGSEAFFLVFVSLLYWCIDARLGMRVALVLLLSTSLNSWLKLVFAGPRPQWYSPHVRAYEAESSFGLPSAHAQNAVTVWGEAAWQAQGRWLRGLAVGLIGLIGFSRIYLGVHFPTDVLLGWGVGLGVLWLFNQFSARVMQRMGRHQLGAQLMLVAVTSLLLLLPSLLVAHLRGPWQMPTAWLQSLQSSAETLPHPYSLDTPVAAAGTWLGFVAGALWLNARKQSFQPRGHVWRRGRQYVIGISVAIVLWAGLDQLFPEGSTLVAYSLRYLRYALLGGWITAGAPLLFRTKVRSM